MAYNGHGSMENICDLSGSRRRGGEESDELSFEKLTERLERMRTAENEILAKIEPGKTEASKSNIFQECINNFKERAKLLDEYSMKIGQAKLELVKSVKDQRESLRQDSKNERAFELNVGIKLSESKLKNLKYLELTVKAEKDREEFRKRRIIEKIMANYLESEEVAE